MNKIIQSQIVKMKLRGDIIISISKNKIYNNRQINKWKQALS